MDPVKALVLATEQVEALVLVLGRMISTFYGQDEGDPPPFKDYTEALYVCTNAIDRAKGRPPTFPET